LSEAARERLSNEGYDPIYGARPLKRVIQQRILDPLAMQVLQGNFRDGDTILVDATPEGFAFVRAGDLDTHDEAADREAVSAGS